MQTLKYLCVFLSISVPKVLISHLRITPSCNRSSISRDKKVFTFCQNGQCCSTSPLLFHDENCKEELLYQESEIGECAQFKFDFYNKIEGNVTYAEMDVQLLFKDGSVSVCRFYNHTNLDGNDTNRPKFLDFGCQTPRGMFFVSSQHFRYF